MIAFVQSADSGTPVGTASTVSKAFTSYQTAGNLNVVVINFGKFSGSFTETVSSVTDTIGNTYYQAAPLNRMDDGTGEHDALVVYYAHDIASGPNTVTVTLSAACDFFAISILEYFDIAVSGPVDVTASNISSGSSAPTLAGTGYITTSNDNNLIIGAFCLFDGPLSGDAGYTVRSNFYTILVEDQIVSSVGSYGATAVSANTGGWIGQIIAFKDSSASVSQDYAIISDDGSSVLTIMTMDPGLKENMLANNPALILLPVNMIAKPSFILATQSVIQTGWTIGPVDVKPVWVVIPQTNDQMVVSAAQLYYNTVTPGVVESFTSALSSWGAQNSTTKDALLVKLLDSVNAILQFKFGLQLPIRLSMTGSFGVTGVQQLNKLFLSLFGGIGVTGLLSLGLDTQLNGSAQVNGFISLGLDPQLSGTIGLSGVLVI